MRKEYSIDDVIGFIEDDDCLSCWHFINASDGSLVTAVEIDKQEILDALEQLGDYMDRSKKIGISVDSVVGHRTGYRVRF